MSMPFPLRAALCFSLAILLAPDRPAAAAGCSKTCGSQVRACAADARPFLLECTAECESTALRGEMRTCRDECRGMLRMARKTCRTGRAGCIEACKLGVDVALPDASTSDGNRAKPPSTTNPTSPGSSSASCMGRCGQSLGSCAHDAASSGASCIRDCKSAPNRQACIFACTSSAQEGHDDCKAAGRECRSDCGFQPSTTTTLGENPATTTTLPETTTTTLPETTTTTLAEPATTTTTLAEPVTTTTLIEPVTTTTLAEPVTTTTLAEPVTTTTLAEPVTTTTLAEPATTTTLGAGAAACPDVGELVLYAGIGQFCSSNADCPVGTCEDDSRCHTVTRLDSGWTGLAHNSDINDQILTRGFLDCPGPGPVCGECNVEGIDPSTGSCRCANNIRTVCDEPFVADADDCGGAVCDCYFGAPFPLSSGGTPACVLNRFANDISGTANVDLGAGEIHADLRAKVYLGAATRSPCNPCGGKCSNNAAVLCNQDQDCPGGTCTLDSNPGDGVREGFCTQGDSQGQTCDPTGYNSSFPAYRIDDGPSGGWYSLDCPPDAGKNISGIGLVIGLTQTTGTSELEANVSCGGASPELNCPCMQCSGDPTVPCNSNADCETMSGTCSLAPSKQCGTNTDCTGVNAGNCTASIKRCQFATSISCNVNSDCASVNVGTCNPSTCSVKGVGSTGVFPLPNDCEGMACTDLGGGEGECTNGPDATFCDAVVKANGDGILSCTFDDDCAAAAVGVDAGQCLLSQRAKCFLDPITATGTPDPETPIGVSTFCIPPTSNSGINTVAGLPGPGRIRNQATAKTFCETDRDVQYIPGVGGCPAP